MSSGRQQVEHEPWPVVIFLADFGVPQIENLTFEDSSDYVAYRYTQRRARILTDISSVLVDRTGVMAESGGFEPPVQVSPYNGLANRRLQPLGQLSSETPIAASIIA